MNSNEFLNSYFEYFPEKLEILENNVIEFLELLKTFLLKNSNSSINATNKINNSIVDKSTYVGDYTLIRNSFIGKNCKIGSHVEINNSIIMNNTTIPHHNYIGYSLLGNNITLGGNVRTTVRRLDDKNIKIHLPDKTIYQTKRHKYGSIIGDNCKFGSNVILNPGVIIGKKSIIEPSLIIRGYIKENSYIKNHNI